MNHFPVIAEPSIASMVAVLRKNCIDYVVEEGYADRPATLYVTEFAFPCWIRLDRNERFICLNTYIETSDRVSDEEYLELVNRLNEEFVLLQFCFNRDLRRLSAAYMIPAQSGVTEAQFVVLARLFPEIFAQATASRNSHGEFVPPQTGPCQLIVINNDS